MNNDFTEVLKRIKESLVTDAIQNEINMSLVTKEKKLSEIIHALMELVDKILGFLEKVNKIEAERNSYIDIYTFPGSSTISKQTMGYLKYKIKIPWK